MDSLLRHELSNGTGERVLRYFGRPVRPDGQPHPLADPDILSRAGVWYDGVRMKHWLDGNSVKFYNEHNALRFETTLNNPAPFKVWRCKEGSPDGAKERLPLRKNVPTTQSATANSRLMRILSGPAALLITVSRRCHPF